MLSKKQLLILEILYKNHPKEMYGLDIVIESEGKLRRGAIYIDLGRLVELGEVGMRRDGKPIYGVERILYRLTSRGHRSLQESRAGPEPLGDMLPST